MAKSIAAERRDSPLSLNTRQIVVAGILGAVAIFLGYTRLGFIPVPNLSGNATIMHIPAILGGVLEGPVVGVLAGGIFGVFSWLDASSPLFKDPLVAIFPRLLIGLAAWAVFAALRPYSVTVASAASGVVGSATNTIFVVAMIIVRGLVPRGTTGQAFVLSVVPQAVAEAVIAAIITVVVVRSVLVYRSGVTTAPDIQSGREQRY